MCGTGSCCRVEAGVFSTAELDAVVARAAERVRFGQRS
jgi:hypothetical protein